MNSCKLKSSLDSININFSGWFYSNYNVSGSSDFTLDTIPRYPSVSQSLNTRTLNSIKMNYSSDSTCDYLWYSTNNGSNWTGIDITDGTITLGSDYYASYQQVTLHSKSWDNHQINESCLGIVP